MLGVSEYEKREIKVSKTDLELLLLTNHFLSNENKWGNSISRTCRNGERYSLYCELEAASVAY